MNVLLVDDDRIFNLLSKKTLGNMDFIEEIHTALNGQEAIDLINDYFQGAKTLPDIILLDLNMPIMDGFGFIEAFKKLDANGDARLYARLVHQYSEHDRITCS